MTAKVLGFLETCIESKAPGVSLARTWPWESIWEANEEMEELLSLCLSISHPSKSVKVHTHTEEK